MTIGSSSVTKRREDSGSRAPSIAGYRHGDVSEQRDADLGGSLLSSAERSVAAFGAHCRRAMTRPAERGSPIVCGRVATQTRARGLR
jgi:hypothetical protein